MENNYKIRKFDWLNLDSDGLPKDAVNTMDFFNLALERKLYQFIPFDSVITKEVILKEWLPYAERSIGYVAETKSGKIIGTGILFVRDKYFGELQIALDPINVSSGIGTKITKLLIDESQKKKITFVAHTSVENLSMQKVFEKLGYKPMRVIKNYETYVGKIKASTFDAYEYIIV